MLLDYTKIAWEWGSIVGYSFRIKYHLHKSLSQILWPHKGIGSCLWGRFWDRGLDWWPKGAYQKHWDCFQEFANLYLYILTFAMGRPLDPPHITSLNIIVYQSSDDESWNEKIVISEDDYEQVAQISRLAREHNLILAISLKKRVWSGGRSICSTSSANKGLVFATSWYTMTRQKCWSTLEARFPHTRIAQMIGNGGGKIQEFEKHSGVCLGCMIMLNTRL